MGSCLFLFLLTVALVLLVFILHDHSRNPTFEQGRTERRQLMRELRLTDLALWTEARHTRHPSQADLFTPFQNGPATPDAFPSGSWTLPVPRRTRGYDLDP